VVVVLREEEGFAVKTLEVGIKPLSITVFPHLMESPGIFLKSPGPGKCGKRVFLGKYSELTFYDLKL